MNSEKVKYEATPPPRDAEICVASICAMNQRSVNIITAKAPLDTTMGMESRNNSRNVVMERIMTNLFDCRLWPSGEYRVGGCRYKDRRRFHSAYQ